MKDLVTRAKTFAFAAHNAIGQRRKYTDEPYTAHLERVAQLVASVVDDDAMIAAAYLHDTVEDTPTTIDDISQEFGDDVACLVNYLSDVSRPEDGNRALRKQLDREHIARGDARVHTIKLADLIDNSESIQANDPNFARVYMNEKRLLLNVLEDGHPVLFERARDIVDAWFAAAGRANTGRQDSA
jgi:(p)ppGpp synthase/HD superfamily hydrolase